MKESDLYLPLKTYLEKQGYKVNSEVCYCDLTAIKDDELIIIELKLHLSLKLIAQAVKRQEISDSVYVAVPIAVGKKQISNYVDASRILKRLGIGLILVHFYKTRKRVEIAFHPTNPEGLPPRKRHKKRDIIIREIHSRFVEFNKAGQSNTAHYLSAYRQQALLVAWHLSQRESASPAELKKLGTSPKTGAILYSNLFGWFDHPKRAIYTLSKEGFIVLQQEREVIEKILTVSKKH